MKKILSIMLSLLLLLSLSPTALHAEETDTPVEPFDPVEPYVVRSVSRSGTFSKTLPWSGGSMSISATVRVSGDLNYSQGTITGYSLDCYMTSFSCSPSGQSGCGAYISGNPTFVNNGTSVTAYFTVRFETDTSSSSINGSITVY